MRAHRPSRDLRAILGSVALVLLCSSLAAEVELPHPNVLLFTADDLHCESVGAFTRRPSELTPHLDRFAGEGMLFERAHVNAAICQPSRAILATGLYSHRSGAMGFMKSREDVPDIVTLLQAGGYLAGVLGKLNHSTSRNAVRWDYAFDRMDLGNGRHPQTYFERCRNFFALAERAGKPFYLMVNSHDPHRPYCNPEKLLPGAARPSRIWSAEEVEVPGFLPDLPGVREELSHYYNSVRRLDDVFGRVLEALGASGQSENTLVLFLSDNGIAVPFAKCNSWFWSTRTPLLVRWPGEVAAGSRDEVHFVSGIDFLPTILDVTGVEGPSDLDGRSFLPLLRCKPQAGRDLVFTQIDKKAGGQAVPMRCVQTADYGYIWNPFADGVYRYRNNNEGLSMRAMEKAAQSDPQIAARVQLFRYRVSEELYDLRRDPDCLHNLIEEPRVSEPLRTLRAKLRSQMAASDDPMLPAFEARADRTRVDRVLEATYGKGSRTQQRRTRKRN